MIRARLSVPYYAVHLFTVACVGYSCFLSFRFHYCYVLDWKCVASSTCDGTAFQSCYYQLFHFSFRLILCGDNPVCGFASIYTVLVDFISVYIFLSGLLPVVRGWCRRCLAYEEQSCHFQIKQEYFKFKVNLNWKSIGSNTCFSFLLFKTKPFVIFKLTNSDFINQTFLFKIN